MVQHLLHIGYAKAASSFLQKWFALHPELHYAPGGLGGFHNVYELRPQDGRIKYHVTSYEGLASPNPLGFDATFGHRQGPLDPAPVKEVQAKICALLHDLYPGSRVVLVTRGFRSLIMSNYSQYVRRGGIHHLPGMCELAAEYLRQDLRHFLDIDYIVDLYVEAFGDEHVVILPFELVRDDSTTFLSILADQLGLEHHDLPSAPVNPSLSPAELYWYPVLSNVVSRALAFLGPRPYDRTYRRYVELLMDNRLRAPIRALHQALPARTITADDFPEEILDCCRGKARSLQRYPVFAAYGAEYLWGQEDSPVA